MVKRTEGGGRMGSEEGVVLIKARSKKSLDGHFKAGSRKVGSKIP